MKYFIVGVMVDDGPTGIPEEYDVKIGPFEEEKANKILEQMEDERWISGSNIYYGLHLEKVGDGNNIS